ncbi:hypothetical protein KDM41_17545, partial [bacterium]|nr:hypothetical protein [bacterium]
APPGVSERFLPVGTPRPAGARLHYRPAVWAEAGLHYANARAQVDTWTTVNLVAPAPDGAASPWDEADELPAGVLTETAPAEEATWAEPPAALAGAKTRERWSGMLKSHLYRERPLLLWTCSDPKAVAEPGEDEGRFRARLGELSREDRDLAAEKLRARYVPKLKRLEEKIRRAEAKVATEQSQVNDKKMATAVNLGATVLGALFGRKLASAGTVQRAGSTARSMGRIGKEKADVDRARAALAAAQAELEAMDVEFRDQLAGLPAPDVARFALDELPVRARKTDIAVETVGLAWTPWWVGADGVATPAFAVTPEARV